MSGSSHRAMERSRRAGVRPGAHALVGVVVLAAIVAGCASTAAPEPGVPPSERMSRGLSALQAGEYGSAGRELLSVRDACPGEPLGDQALLLWAATELDPRNPDPDLNEVARVAALHLAGTAETAWTRPLAESLYLLALERGASVPDAVASSAPDSGDRGESESGSPRASRHRLVDTKTAEDSCRPLPPVASSGPARSIADSADAARDTTEASATVRLPDLPGQPFTTRITRLENRTEELEGTTLQLRRVITELEQELERIREILRP